MAELRKAVPVWQTVGLGCTLPSALTFPSLCYLLYNSLGLVFSKVCFTFTVLELYSYLSGSFAHFDLNLHISWSLVSLHYAGSIA